MMKTKPYKWFARLVLIGGLCILCVWFYSPITIINFLLPGVMEHNVGTGGWGARAESENTNVVHLAIGAHHYAIQRNYIEFYNKDKPIQDIIPMQVYIPGFAPIREAMIAPFNRPGEATDHIVNIDLSPRYASWKSQAEHILENKQKQGLAIESEASDYELVRLHNVRGWGDTNMLEFFGDTNTGKLYILCDNILSPGLYSSCRYTLPFADLIVTVNFDQKHLSEWKYLYQSTIQLLERFKED